MNLETLAPYALPLAMGFVGSLLWAVWSRLWDWWVGPSETEDAHARHLIKRLGHLTTMEHNAVTERLDKIEDIVYNARGRGVPYASKAAGYPVDPPTCW